MSRSADLAALDPGLSSHWGFRNKLINGNFDVWQRGTSLAASAVFRYLADRWVNAASGSTIAPSQQAFLVGQTDVPGEPRFFHRSTVVTSSGASNYAVLAQRIESVRTLAGKTVSVSFYAKADSAKNIALEIHQTFGTNGSSAATGTGQVCQLSTSWAKYTLQFAIPSISGKTLDDANNDHSLNVQFWFDAGSSNATRSGSIGQQSGTFDIAQVQLEAGVSATAFEFRPIALELACCQRFYETSFPSGATPAQNYGVAGATPLSQISAASTNGMLGHISYKATKRASPTITLFNPSAANAQVRNVPAAADFASSVSIGWVYGFSVAATAPSNGAAGNQVIVHWTADCEL